MPDIPYLFDSYVGGTDSKVTSVQMDNTSSVLAGVTDGLDLSGSVAKESPTDEQLTSSIREFIDKSDIYTITFKKLKEHLDKIYAIDLSGKKDFIRGEVDRMVTIIQDDNGTCNPLDVINKQSVPIFDIGDKLR